MAIQIREIDHVVLRVTDVDRALAFYCDVLGCREERRAEKLGLIQLRAGAALIDLVDLDGQIGRQGGAGPAESGRNMDHFCVRIEPFDEPAIRAHLAAHDIECRKPLAFALRRIQRKSERVTTVAREEQSTGAAPNQLLAGGIAEFRTAEAGHEDYRGLGFEANQQFQTRWFAGSTGAQQCQRQ